MLFAIVALLSQACALLCVSELLEQVSEASSLAGEWVDPLQRALAWVGAFAIARIGAEYCSQRVAVATKSTISTQVFDKLVELGSPYLHRVQRSALVQLFGEGVEHLSAYLCRYAPQFFCAVAAPVFLAVLLGLRSPFAAAAMLVFVFCMPVAIMRFMRRARERAGEQWGSYTNLGAAFYDAVRGLSTLKVFRADADTQWALEDQAEFFRTTVMRLLHVQLNSITFMDLFTYGGIAAGCAIAVVQAALGSLSVADAFGIMLVAPLMFAPMRTFGTLFHVGTNGEDVAQELFRLLDEQPVCGGGETCASQHPEISCSNLSFAYGEDGAALDHISFDVPANSIVGITGESGSGKSTLARVLSGQAAPYSGSVKIGGIEVAELDPDALRGLVTVVSKDSHLFKGTVRSNMLLADPAVPDAFIWDALRRARIADEVKAAGGLDAMVEEGGANFSGGQRQRLCFARAIIRDTPIYLFDEAASNVDAESEKLLYNAMHEIAFTKTVVVVSHRLAMLTWVDELLVLDEGKLVQRGPTSKLIAQDGCCKRLWEQYRALEEFAARLAADDEVGAPEVAPSAVDEVIASLPGMAATAMQAVVDAKSLQQLASTDPNAPSGHPAWIPLPASCVGSSAVQEGNAQKGASGEKEGSSANVEGYSLLATIRKLYALTIPMRSDLREALFAGFASNLAAVALAGFAAYALLSAKAFAAPIGVALGIAGMAICALGRGPLHYGERLYTHDQTFKTLALVRSRVFEAMRALAPAKLEERDAGDMVSLLTSDVELLEGFYSRSLTPFAATLACACAVCAVALVAAPPLGVALLACTLAGGIALPLALEHIGRRRGADVRAFAVAMESFLFDCLEGFDDLLQFGRAKEYAEEMRVHFATLGTGEMAQGLSTSLGKAAADVLALLCQVLVVFLAWLSVESHAVGVAPALLVSAVALATISQLSGLGGISASIQQTHAAASRVLALLDEQPATPDVVDGANVLDFSGAQADGVSFGYGADAVLDKVSIEVGQGLFVRVTGESGSGKTTLLRLLMRFWDPDSGAVRVSGTDLRELSTSSLRALESYLAQDTYLFARTLRENIRLANRKADAAQLEAAIKAAALDDLVSRLPQGLDTMVGEGGVRLSSGERQRVGLARAFLQDAPFIVLDEPTSNLDAINEAAILYSLASNTQGKTVLVASHRHTMAALSDETIVLQGGHAYQSGSAVEVR